MCQQFAKLDNGGILHLIRETVAVSNVHSVDFRLAIGSGKHQAYLSDITESNRRAIMPQVIGKDGERVQVPVLHLLAQILCGRCIVE